MPSADGIKGAGAVDYFSNSQGFPRELGSPYSGGFLWCGYVGCLVCEIVLIDVSLSFAHALIGDLKFLPLQGNRIPFSYDGALIGVLRTCLWPTTPPSLTSVLY